METAVIFNIQRFSLNDGEGIRTGVFLKGCPLRCVWCHNPESQKKEPEIAFYPAKCIGCGTCHTVCPNGCHTEKGFDRTDCAQCGACAASCPANALEQVGKRMTVEEVLAKVLRDRPFYQQNGGMTVTGGEPMASFPFTLALCKAAKETGIHVVIETSGYAATEHYLALLPYVDCFYYDCKADAAHHRALIGVDDALILRNLDALITHGASVVLRCPIIPGANLTDAYLGKLENLAHQYPTLSGISLLPYHKYGTTKPLSLGGEAQPVFTEPTAEQIHAIKVRLQKTTDIPIW